MIYRSVDQFNQTINEKSTDGVVRDSNQGPQEKKDRGHRQIHWAVVPYLVGFIFPSNWFPYLHSDQAFLWAKAGLFYRLSSVFSNNHHYKFYNKLMWKNVHPVNCAGIWTHNLCNMSLLP